MTKTARITAISALTLACAAATPAAWATGSDEHGRQDSKRHNSERDSKQQDREHNPAGNNGTVKIHQVAGDTSPHNVPHVTCDFYITFFGFDTNQTADLTLTGQAPTGKGTALWSKDDAPISSDDAGGGKDVDNEFHVTAAELGLDRLGDPHPKQGYHLKLAVDVNDAPGGAKHKVFWLEPCATPAAVGGTTGNLGGTTGSAGTTGSTGSTGGVAGTGATAGETVSGADAVAAGTTTTPGATVLGVQYTRDTAGSTPGVLGESLPFTGIPLVGLAAGAALATGAGVVMVQAGRRRVNDL